MSSSVIYLDHAAATPLSPAVSAAMKPYFVNNFYNPSATYQAARAVRSDVDKARGTIAKALGVRPVEIVFTAGATEANNLAIQGIMKKFPDGNIVVSAIEHDSVLEVAKRFDARVAPVDPKGHIVMEQLSTLIDDQTVLVSCMYANNEIGSVQHLQTIAALLQAIRDQRTASGNDRPLYLHTDAAQALNYLKVLPNQLGVDLLSLNGGKIYGPKQSGLLFVRVGVELEPLVYGGGQERGIRSGTENVPAILGLAAAITETINLQSTETQRLRELQQYFVRQLAELIPGVEITAATNQKLPNIVHITLPGHDNERLMMELDERGIQCAVGSACSASNDEPSHVLKAIGQSDKQAQSSLRFSMGRSTTKKDIDTTVKALRDIVHG